MERQTILIVEDEPGIGNFIETSLSSNGYAVLRAKDGSTALMLITSHCPDLVLLDLGLPDMDGAKIIRAVRAWSGIPIVVVSARAHERDKVETLDLGADDYVTKPFSSAELLARIRTALRHAQRGPDLPQTNPGGRVRIGELTVDYDKRHVYVSGEDVHLTQNEYKIVALLSRYAGRVLTYDHIIKAVWGPNSGGDNQILRVNMANIRRKIEKNPADPQFIFTEMGVGYRMADAD
ncbi:MAG: response regulator transcription factor [Oscillospiraceae bacterium]|nr:response regulator transcription factor [Oscillospiraceae bacterium]